MAIRAIALDIDGTLTNDQKVITPRTKKALMDAQEAGIKSSSLPVVLSTACARLRTSSSSTATMAC